MPYSPTVTDQSGQLLAQGIATTAKQQSLSADDWDERLKLLESFGVDKEGLLMRGTQWRKGLAAEREAFQKDTRDSLRRALGFKSTETSAALGAAASAGKAATASSL